MKLCQFEDGGSVAETNEVSSIFAVNIVDTVLTVNVS